MLIVTFCSEVGIETRYCSRVSILGELFWLDDEDGVPYKHLNFEDLLSIKISKN